MSIYFIQNIQSTVFFILTLPVLFVRSLRTLGSLLKKGTACLVEITTGLSETHSFIMLRFSSRHLSMHVVSDGVSLDTSSSCIYLSVRMHFRDRFYS